MLYYMRSGVKKKTSSAPILNIYFNKAEDFLLAEFCKEAKF